MTSPLFISPFRLALVVGVVLVAFASVFLRLVYLHVYAADDLASAAIESRQHRVTLPARRGTIVDRRGVPLAISRETWRVGVDPTVVEDEDSEKITALAALLELEPRTIEEAFSRKWRIVEKDDGSRVREINRWVKLSEGVERDTLEAVQALGIRAVYGNPEHRRIYPAGASAAHLIGFINANGDGTGIEQYFDYYLQGQPGYRETERDGHRRELVRSRTREIAPTPGHTVRLSIDRNIQHIVESVLAEAVEEWQPKAATVIVSDPRSGFLHALANYPSFDLNVYGKSLPQERLNRAIAAVYEPGSTFKIVTVAAALDLGLVSEADIVKTSHGVVRYKGRKVRLPTDEGDYSELSVRDVLVKSSNRGAALLGMRMGAESLYTYTRAFGFGTPTRLGGYAEALWKTGFPEEPGLLNPPEQWDSLTITRLPIGYAVAATPLQVHMATCAVANGGLLHRPQVVERVSDHEGRLVMAFEPDVRRRVIAADTAARVREILREVTTPAGTAKRAAVPGYTTAGKTGTTQKVVQLGSERGYSSAHHIASFSGFLPAALPELAITVVIDEPQSDGPGFGGRYAAPIFRKVADDVARYLGIEADRNALTAINQKGGTYGHSR